MPLKNNMHSAAGALPAVLVIEDNKFQRRSLGRLLRAAGAPYVAEAVDLPGALQLLDRQHRPHWLAVADPDHVSDPELRGLRELARQHPALDVLLLTERRPPAAAELKAQAQRIGLPLADALRKPISGEEAGILLARLASQRSAPSAATVFTEDELNDCLRRGRLHARFQPQIDLDSGKPLAWEASSYLLHPRHGEVPASSVGFPLSNLGAQRMLTASLLREAAGLIRLSKERKLDIQVGVDLALEMLSESGDAHALDSYVRTLGIAPQDLALEVQPARLSLAAPDISDNLARLKLRGYTLVLDHAEGLEQPAPGYFSQAKLKCKAHANQERSRLARCLPQPRPDGLTFCALGIDSAAELEQARATGFDRAQGAWIGAPMPAADVVGFCQREHPHLGGSRHRNVQDAWAEEA